MQKPPVRFIHAADLHLYATLGLGGLAGFFPETASPSENLNTLGKEQIEPTPGQLLRLATVVALHRLELLCKNWQPHFLVLAGDNFTEENSLPAQLALRDFCTRLFPLPIFLCCGNHDPLSARLEHIVWPDNALFFGPQPEAYPVYGQPGTPLEGQVMAMVHGFSYAQSKEKRNIAQLFRRGEENCPHIGVLHTALCPANESEPSAQSQDNAPCSLDDLRAAGMDYWALGHVHAYTTLCEQPPVVYAGATQGLYSSELGMDEGPHGCVCVSLETNTPQPACTLDFHPLAPLQWHSLRVCVEKVVESAQAESQALENKAVNTHAAEYTALENLADLELFLRQNLFPATFTADHAADAQGTDQEEGFKPLSHLNLEGCRVVVLRLILTGRTALDAELHSLQARQNLVEALNEYALQCCPPDQGLRLCVHDIVLETKPLFERSQAVERPDLLGEVLREADAWKSGLLAQKTGQALAELFSRSPRTQNHKLFHLNAEERNHVLTEAERLCVDLLEKN